MVYEKGPDVVSEKRFFPASTLDEVAYLFEVGSSYSITYGIAITLEGDIHSEIVREALDSTLNYFPKSKCVLSKDYSSLKRLFRYSWEYRDISSADIFEEIQDLKSDSKHNDAVSYFSHYYRSHTIDVTRETSPKVMLIRNHGRAHLLFFMHHAVADGKSLIFFIQQFIQFYENIFYQKKKEIQPPPDFDGISQPHFKFRWKYLSPKLISATRRFISLLDKETPVKFYPQEADYGASTFIAAGKELSHQQFDLIRARVKNQKTTINSYFLASMFPTIKKWNQPWNPPPGRVYISAPINLRSPEDRTIGNLVSAFHVSLRSELISDRDSVLPLVHEEQLFKMEYARQSLNLLCFLKPIPLALKISSLKSRQPDMRCTILLTNLGKCTLNQYHTDKAGVNHMGPARISSINTILYPHPMPQVTVTTYNEKVFMSLSVLRSHFSKEDAGKFLDLFTETLLAE